MDCRNFEHLWTNEKPGRIHLKRQTLVGGYWFYLETAVLIGPCRFAFFVTRSAVTDFDTSNGFPFGILYHALQVGRSHKSDGRECVFYGASFNVI
ncbi:hypothetical protein IAD21_06422 (plasmid) [Abditibacteriota bacterium]|nr:hypothetical protein IAD21_06422 [Abditibacteriota bacterium]